MNSLEGVRSLLKAALQLGDRANHLTEASPLLGAIAEFDSMAVVTVMALMEERYDIRISDDEISAETFSTVGSLMRFLEEKTSQ